MENLKISAFYEPTMAITIYKNNQHSDHLSSFYIESHDIIDNQMSAGKPLTDDCFSELSDFIIARENNLIHSKGIIPVNVLYHKANLKKWPDMIWYVKAGPKEMHFENELNIPDGKAQTPMLLFASIAGGFYVFAIKGNKRPDLSTILYQPPFHNCAKDGNVCLGSAKLAKPTHITWENLMKYHESRFWRSIFSHNGSASIKGNLNLVWKDLILHPEKKFDTKVLIKSKTLKDLLK